MSHNSKILCAQVPKILVKNSFLIINEKYGFFKTYSKCIHDFFPNIYINFNYIANIRVAIKN